MSGSLFLSTVLKVFLLFFIPALQAQTLTIDSVPKSPVRVNVGESLTLEISSTYTGIEKVVVEWKNASGKILIRRTGSGTIFSFDRRASLKDADLILNNTILNDNGTYEVDLIADDVSSPAKKTVVVIVQVRSDVSINCRKESKTGGETVKCDCTTSNGSPPPWVRWYKDGAPVDGHDAEYEKSTLTLTDIKENDAGTYTCRATSGTLVTNEPKQLYGPKNTRFTNSNSTYVGAKYFKITCKTDCNPEATYTLSHEGKELNTNGGVYTIATVNDSHGGSYSCVAKNFGSETASFELYVSGLDGPTDVKFNNEKTAALNTNLKIICEADGYPEPTYVFYHNQCKITENVEKNVYTISGVKYEDAGNYTCVAKNKYGTASKSFDLQVTDPEQLVNSNSENKWYYYLITFLCGMLVGMAFLFMIIKLRQRWAKQQSEPTTEYEEPVPQNTGTNAPVYQDLDLQRMNQEENYQGLRKNVRAGSENKVEYEENEGGYQELNNPKGRHDENYQSLQKV